MHGKMKKSIIYECDDQLTRSPVALKRVRPAWAVMIIVLAVAAAGGVCSVAAGSVRVLWIWLGFFPVVLVALMLTVGALNWVTGTLHCMMTKPRGGRHPRVDSDALAQPAATERRYRAVGTPHRSTRR